MKKCVAALLLAALSLPAHAEMEIKEFREARGNFPMTTQTYLAGMYQGISWANSKLIFEKRQPLYCPPASFTLTYENVIAMLTTHLNDASSNIMRPETPVGVVMVAALAGNFPCASPPPGVRM